MLVSAWLYLAQQSLLTLCLLLSLQRIVRLPQPAPLRLHITSLLMGTGSLLTAMHGEVWGQALLLLFSALIPFSVWPGIPRRLRFRVTMTLAASLLLLTGWERMLAGFGLPAQMLIPMGCVLMLLLPALLASHPAACAAVCIVLGERRMTLTALVDSGNLLKDRATGLPVIVIARRAALRLLAADPTSSALPDMRLMPVRTVAGTATMTIFRPDALLLEIEGRWRTVQAMIGLAPDGYSGVQALVPALLITQVEQTVDCKEDVLCP